MSTKTKEQKGKGKGNIDIKIKEINYTKKKDLINSRLELDFSGKDINNVVLNTIRRVIIDNIPTYAIPRDKIIIEANTSVLNNDQLQVRLENLPIFGISSELFYLHQKYWKDINFTDKEREKHPDEKLVQLYVNVHNNTPNNLNVTTNDIQFLVDGDIVNSGYNPSYPIVLVQLRPNETIKCNMTAVLGTSEIKAGGAKWSATSSTAFDEINDMDDDNGAHHFTFFMESLGQLSEYNILIKACKFINKKMDDIKTEYERQIKSKELLPSSQMQLEIQDEDYTIGQILTSLLQEHDNIIFAGGGRPDHQIKLFRIKAKTKDNKDNVIDAFFDCIDKTKNIVEHLEDEFSKLSKSKK